MLSLLLLVLPGCVIDDDDDDDSVDDASLVAPMECANDNMDGGGNCDGVAVILNNGDEGSDEGDDEGRAAAGGDDGGELRDAQLVPLLSLRRTGDIVRCDNGGHIIDADRGGG
jgi:hypothetical protein